jgi:hypothetical protein
LHGDRALAPQEHISVGSKEVPRIICFPKERKERPAAHDYRTGTLDLVGKLRSAGAEAKAALAGGGTLLHVDVMDGHFVPNITIGPPVVASLRKMLPDTILDCHLMIENPDLFIPAFAEAGASWISVHQEA